MFEKLPNTVVEALNRRHLPTRIAQHEERIREWFKIRNSADGILARMMVRKHSDAIRDLRKSL